MRTSGLEGLSTCGMDSNYSRHVCLKKMSGLLASARISIGVIGGMGYEQGLSRSSALDIYSIHLQALGLRTTGILGAQWVFRFLSF